MLFLAGAGLGAGCARERAVWTSTPEVDWAEARGCSRETRAALARMVDALEERPLVRTRPVWPEGVTPAVRLCGERGDFVVPIGGRLRLAGPAGAPLFSERLLRSQFPRGCPPTPTWDWSFGENLMWEDLSILVSPACDLGDEVAFTVEIEVARFHDQDLDSDRPATIRQEVRLPIRRTAEVSSVIKPVDDPALTALLAERLYVDIIRNSPWDKSPDQYFVTINFEPVPGFPFGNTAVGMRFELRTPGGEVLPLGRLWFDRLEFPDREPGDLGWFHCLRFVGEAEARIAEMDLATLAACDVIVTADAEMALHDFEATRYWVGEIVQPLIDGGYRDSIVARARGPEHRKPPWY